MRLSHQIALVAAAVAAMSLAAVPGAAGDEENAFVVHNLVSDVAGRADHVDANLVNGWGLAALPTSPWWVAGNGTDVATIYQADGTKAPLTVQVPKAPTGEVANAGSSFVVSNGSASGPARFL